MFLGSNLATFECMILKTNLKDGVAKNHVKCIKCKGISRNNLFISLGYARVTYTTQGGHSGSPSQVNPKGEEHVELGMDLYPTGSSIPDCSHACGPCFPCRRGVSFQFSQNVVFAGGSQHVNNQIFI
ncbi:hypothetical protein R6Q57_016198 [Mikania cordata]